MPDGVGTRTIYSILFLVGIHLSLRAKPHYDHSVGGVAILNLRPSDRSIDRSKLRLKWALVYRTSVFCSVQRFEAWSYSWFSRSSSWPVRLVLPVGITTDRWSRGSQFSILIAHAWDYICFIRDERKIWEKPKESPCVKRKTTCVKLPDVSGGWLVGL